MYYKNIHEVFCPRFAPESLETLNCRFSQVSLPKLPPCTRACSCWWYWCRIAPCSQLHTTPHAQYLKWWRHLRHRIEVNDKNILWHGCLCHWRNGINAISSKSTTAVYLKCIGLRGTQYISILTTKNLSFSELLWRHTQCCIKPHEVST